MDSRMERVRRISCANPTHEAQCAVTWATRCLARAIPAERIAIASLDPAHHHLALITAARESNLPIGPRRGGRVLDTDAGQIVAALVGVVDADPDREAIERYECVCSAHATNNAEHAANGRIDRETARAQAEKLGVDREWAALEAAASTAKTNLSTALRTLPEPAPDDDAGIAWNTLKALDRTRCTHLWLMGADARRWTQDVAADMERIVQRGSTTVIVSRARQEDAVTTRPATPEIAERALARGQSEHPDTALWTARREDATWSTRSAQAKTLIEEWTSDEGGKRSGCIEPAHPVVRALLERPSSATQASRLAHNPLGWLWRYALRLSEPDGALGDDPRAWGTLVHRVLERTTNALRKTATLEEAVHDALERERVERTHDDLPPLLRERMLERAGEAASWALGSGPGAEHAHVTEVRFAGRSRTRDMLPALKLEASGITIEGWIDRVDEDAERNPVAIVDYKTGKRRTIGTQTDTQRCLYAEALRRGAQARETPQAWIAWVLEESAECCDNVEDKVKIFDEALAAVRTLMTSGTAPLAGEAGTDTDPLKLLLPAVARRGGIERKTQWRDALVHEDCALRRFWSQQ